MPLPYLKTFIAIDETSRCRSCKSQTSGNSEFLLSYLRAEAASRGASERASLLRRCALPAPKTFDGYDWGIVSWPQGFGRDDLPPPSFLGARGTWS